MSETVNKTKKLKIAFVHPDLGIGGAERLVVDAAVGLQEQGHEVIIYTSHCDKNHCFEELKTGLLRVEVFGDELPTNFFGKFFIVFANLRQLYLVLQLILNRKVNSHDLFIIDQLSTCLPFLHVFSSAKLMFYCHFPDQLLALRSSIIKKLYRIPFDTFEQFTMSSADCVVVNSNFTKSVYQGTFHYLKEQPNVIYPCVDLSFQTIDDIDKTFLKSLLNPNDKFYLSINRYERKKNILLALEAFAMSGERDDNNSKLIICGGYDERVTENVNYLEELQKAADVLELSHSTIFYPEVRKNSELEFFTVSNSKVLFLTSISSSLKELLLSKTELLLYTPSFEHFGIVPLEAMKHGKPVLAVKTGGPLETVEPFIFGQNESVATGWLKISDPKEWAKAIDEYKNVSSKKLGNFEQSGPSRVRKYFSREAMTRSFEENIDTFIDSDRKSYTWETMLKAAFNFLIHLLIYYLLDGQSWPYLLMALTTGIYFKSFRFGVYWTAVYASKAF